MHVTITIITLLVTISIAFVSLGIYIWDSISFTRFAHKLSPGTVIVQTRPTGKLSEKCMTIVKTSPIHVQVKIKDSLVDMSIKSLYEDGWRIKNI